MTQAKNSGMLLLSLINDILDITRIESGHLALDIATFSLSVALEEAVALLQHKASEKRISLSLEVAPAQRAGVRVRVRPLTRTLRLGSDPLP